MALPKTTAEIKADFVIYLNSIQVNEDFFVQTIQDSSIEEFLNRIVLEYIEECEEHYPGEIDVLLYQALESRSFKAFCIAYLRSYFELFSKED